MTWARPECLWLLAALPLLAALRWTWGRHLRTRHASLGLGVAALGRGASRRRATLRQALLWSGLAAALIALAGPRWGQSEEKRVARGGDLLIALDCSRSMLASDVFPDRSRHARDKALDLVRRLPELRVALLPFAAAPVLRCPLTSDHEALATMLDDCTPELFPASDGWQGTAIGRAVERGVEVLGHEAGRGQAILVVSDGIDPDRAAVERATARASERGIPVYGLFIGDAGRPATITVNAKPVTVTGERDTLDRLAAGTGAISVNAGAGDADIAALAAHLERTRSASPLEERSRLVQSERYQWPAGLAVLLLAAGWLTPTARRRVAAALLLLVTLTPASDPWPALAEALAQSQGDALAHSQGDAAAAQTRLTALVDAHPGFAAARYDLGTLLLERDPVAAERHLAAAASDPPAALVAAIAHNLALARLRLGRWEDALAAADRALKAAPADTDLRRTRDALAAGWQQRQALLAARAKAQPPRPRLAERALPTARVGQALTATLADTGVALAPGARLPDGVRLVEGRLAGTPIRSGRWDLALVLTAADGSRLTDRARLVVLPAAAITTTALPSALADAPWQAALSADGLDCPRWQAEGLPAGLSLHVADGRAVLVGTPLAAGGSEVLLSAADATQRATRTLPLTVAADAVAGEAELPPATAGAPYRARLTVRGDSQSWRWSGVELPAGLTLAADGALAGTPSVVGPTQVRTTALADDSTSVPAVVSLVVRPAPTISCDDPVRLRRARLADHALRGAGGCGTLRFSGSGGPPGVRLDEDGVLRGVPTTLGETVLIATCSDAWDARGERTVRIVVEDPEAQPPQPPKQQSKPKPEKDQPQPKPEPKPGEQPEPEPKPGEQPEDAKPGEGKPSQDPGGSPPPPADPSTDTTPQPEPQPDETSEAKPDPDRDQKTEPPSGNEAPRPATTPVDPGVEAAHRWLEGLPREQRAVLREQLLRSVPPPDRAGQPW